MVWTIGIEGKWWLEGNLGWWRSRFAGNADPLMIFSPLTWLLLAFWATVLLLILSMIGHRFGWKGQALVLSAIGLAQETRERIWFATILPVLTYVPGPIPILAGAGMLIAGGVMGLVVMRLIAGPERASPDGSSRASNPVR